MPTPRLFLAVDVDEVDADWWLDATPADRGVWLTASLLCKRGMTDGYISRRLLRREGITDDDIARLIALGRLEEADAGRLLVVGFTDSNMTRAEYEAKKEAQRQRQARHRSKGPNEELVTRASRVTDASVTGDSGATGRDPSQRESHQSESESEATSSSPPRVRRLAARLARAKADDEKGNAQNPGAFETWCQTTWRDGEGAGIAAALITEHPDHDDDALVRKHRERNHGDRWAPGALYDKQDQRRREHDQELAGEDPSDDFAGNMARARAALEQAS